jgi:hypothetical protein
MKVKLTGRTRMKRKFSKNSHKVIGRHLRRITYCRNCWQNSDSFRGPHKCTVSEIVESDGQSNVGNS